MEFYRPVSVLGVNRKKYLPANATVTVNKTCFVYGNHAVRRAAAQQPPSSMSMSGCPCPGSLVGCLLHKFASDSAGRHRVVRSSGKNRPVQTVRLVGNRPKVAPDLGQKWPESSN
ncbi:mammalian cell entry protein [Anopheles sinensis]|uniref:Mammalian cell entry protein n=1 Tax=Anopheles sinensis TaxID=74873 RepID=A0A084VE01_ANOSI|nr:mammalian cell entry protein [Anopheles sinensis]